MAEHKGHNPGPHRMLAVLLWFGFEIPIGALGALSTGEVAGFAFGLIGCFVAAAISIARVALLPFKPRIEQEEGRSGPASIGAQLVGSTCAGCGERIAIIRGAGRCADCGDACHQDCLGVHQRAKHSAVTHYRG